MHKVKNYSIPNVFNPTQTGLFAHYITGGEGGGGGGPVGDPIVNSLIFNHVTLNFSQYFFDLSLIRIRKKKNQNGGIFLMTSSFVQLWCFGQKMCFGAKFILGPSPIL